MNVEGATALVTGANRGSAPPSRKRSSTPAPRVYGGARDNTTITNPDVIAVLLDVTSSDDPPFPSLVGVVVVREGFPRPSDFSR